VPKPIILTFVAYYFPGYKGGGPIRSIVNLVENLGDMFHFKIVTSDRDFGNSEPYSGIKVNSWQKVGKADVFYMSPGKMNLGYVRRLIRDTTHDLLYLNSFFSPKFTIIAVFLRRLGFIAERKVIVAPRGELSPEALKIKSLKKTAYIYLAKAFGFYRQITWQAASIYEMKDIQAIFNNGRKFSALMPIFIAPDLGMHSDIDLERTSAAKKPGTLKIIFVSRILPKKNLDIAIKMLNDLQGEASFDIYGPLEDGAYWKKCLSIIDQLPSNIRVQYKGGIAHDNVCAVLAEYDLFFFPTNGESFGHVILEALISGCPVLISDRTPWRNLDQKGVGWELPLEQPERFTEVLQKCVDMEHIEWKRLSQYAKEYGKEKTVNHVAIQRNIDLLTFIDI